MIKYLKLALSLIVFLSSILFLDKSISIIILIFLIAYLELEDIRFSFLPLIIVIIYADKYSPCLVILYLLMLITFFKRKNNKYYFLIRMIIILVVINIILYALNLYQLNILYYSFIVYFLYGILLLFYHTNGKSIVCVCDNIPILTIILFYLIIFTYYRIDIKIILFLFMLLYLIDDNKYKIIFTFIYVLLSYYFNKSLNISEISVYSSSYLPLIGFIYLDYDSYIDIALCIIIVIITLVKKINKNTNINNDYFTNQFKEFKEYLFNLSKEEEKLKIEEDIKINKIELIMNKYCNNCSKNTLCKKKLDERYMYILNGIKGGINYYNCPFYNDFRIGNYNHISLSIKQHNTVSYLIDELEYIYHMNLKNYGLYNKLFNELMFYGYYPKNINIYYSIATTFFMIKFNKNKIIIRQLFVKISSKIFKELLDIKIIDKDEYYNVYFYKKIKCHIEYSKTILAKNNNIVSGDNYYIKKDYNESYIFALSDGMGSGHNAYIESSQTLELVKKLAVNHFSIKTSLKLLEEIEALRCDYDSYATLDLLYLNCSIMKAYLYKMGSSVSYIYHNNELISYQNRALPLKLDDINSFYEIELNIGDMIFLLSDGISDFILDTEIKELIDERSTDVTLERIINKIKEKYNNNLCDDLSLIIIKIIE